MNYDAGKCDIAVIGAGHAGIEAALACARMGLDTMIFTINLDTAGNLPCNPAIGGTGKGHLVRELDAMGGEMGIAADKACIQYRMLNLGKGPAVHSLRAQADRRKYQSVVKHTLESQENLRVKQAEIVDIRLENGAVSSLVTHIGAVYRCRAVIVCTGTYLRSSIIIGDVVVDSGPDGVSSSKALTERLVSLGLSMRRFKTGTPPRVNSKTIDLSKMELQPGDEDISPFSFTTEQMPENKAVCYLTYTNEKTHEIIRENLHLSPLYGGLIEGIGARYCPSIEDKIVRFADKSRHQLFLEPMGLDTNEMYLQGFSSSLPEEVQVKMLHSLVGFEKAEMTRPAYAIEYDCVDPTELYATLESKKIPGLYGAGQFNGSSGYEEAAVQGFMAGVNAALKIKGEPELILKRSDGYIGTLIDDLVTKGTNEPYRMMTSRTEYRLLLRQDNADIRLSAFGHRIGLVSNERHEAVLEKYAAVEREIQRLESKSLAPTPELSKMLLAAGTTATNSGVSLANLLRRPQISYKDLSPFDTERPSLSREIFEQVEISLKYAGYIDRQIRQVKEFSKMENRRLPRDLNYEDIKGLRIEARQKLNKIRPENLGQAGRISGVSPADMAALMVYLESRRENKEQRDE